MKGTGSEMDVKDQIVWIYMAQDKIIKATEDWCVSIRSIQWRAGVFLGHFPDCEQPAVAPGVKRFEVLMPGGVSPPSLGGNTATNLNDPPIPKDIYSCLRSLRGRVIADDRRKMAENYIYSFPESAQD